MTLAVSALELTFEKIYPILDCVSCTSETADKLTSLVFYLKTSKDLSLVLDKVRTSEAVQDQIAKFQNDAIEKLPFTAKSKLVGDFSNIDILS